MAILNLDEQRQAWKDLLESTELNSSEENEQLAKDVNEDVQYDALDIDGQGIGIIAKLKGSGVGL